MPFMGRIAGAVAVDLPHPITQRGDFRMRVFGDDDERKGHSSWLVAYAQRYGMRIGAYCLMDNHVHFIAVPCRPDSFGRAPARWSKIKPLSPDFRRWHTPHR